MSPYIAQLRYGSKAVLFKKTDKHTWALINTVAKKAREKLYISLHIYWSLYLHIVKNIGEVDMEADGLELENMSGGEESLACWDILLLVKK